eukprot:499396-Prymnesium_polylepis.1
MGRSCLPAYRSSVCERKWGEQVAVKISMRKRAPGLSKPALACSTRTLSLGPPPAGPALCCVASTRVCP